MRFFGFIIIMALMLAGIQLGGSLSAFYDATAVLIVIGTMMGGFLMAAGPETGKALKAAFSDAETNSLAGLHGLKGGRMGALAGGFLSAMVGLVLLFNNHDDPAAYGPGLALILLGFLWSVFLSQAILLPLQANIEKRLTDVGNEHVGTSETPLDLLIFGSSLVICVAFYAILKAAFSI